MWTNKTLRLLAHEDGSYEWVPPGGPPRRGPVVARRLDHRRDVSRRAADNLLIRGDALNALHSLAREFLPVPGLFYGPAPTFVHAVKWSMGQTSPPVGSSRCYVRR